MTNRYVEALRRAGFEDAAKHLEENPPPILSREDLEQMTPGQIAELDQADVDVALKGGLSKGDES